MVHNAFDLVQIVKNCPTKIESLETWGERLFVGCIDGSLRVYHSQSPDDPTISDTQLKTYVLKNTLVGFSKKAITAMTVLGTRNLLLSLSDALVVHTLPHLDVAGNLSKAKGASCYAWNEKHGFLCAVKQKKLILYRCQGSRDFTEMKELTALDVVQSVAWCGGDSLFLSIRNQYVIMNINSGTTVELFSCGRVAAPLIIPLPTGELLLGKDNIGVFVDQNGKVTQQSALSWSEAPISVAICPPYALGRLSRYIEVRSLREPYGLVQMIPLREIQMLITTASGLAAASETSIFRLTPVPIEVQVVQLAASGEFGDALALCKMLPPEDSALRAAKEDAIHIRYGKFLFDRGQYVEALQQFAASSLSLAKILSFFPCIKLPSFCEGNLIEDSELSETPEGISKGIDTPLAVEDSSVDHAEKEFEDERKKMIALVALIGFLILKRPKVISKAEAELANATVAALVGTQESKQGSATVRRTKTIEKYIECTSEKGEQRVSVQLATVLDTALVQAYLLTNQSLIALQFLKDRHYCDVAACEEMMLGGKHYAELLLLYKHNKMHKEALQLLCRLAENPDLLSATSYEPEQFGSKAVVDYLLTLGSEDHDLILEYAIWILKNNSELSITLFTSLVPPLPSDSVLKCLKSHAPQLQAVYMEEMFKHSSAALSPNLQNELIEFYLSYVLEEWSELQKQGKWDESSHGEYRSKLLAALDKLPGYSPELVLGRLPMDGLYQERALLLGRMKRHQLALTLYAHKLHEPNLALQYCDHVYNTATLTFDRNVLIPRQTNVYQMLLEIYLKPQAAINEFDRVFTTTLTHSKTMSSHKTGPPHRVKGIVLKKVRQIEENRQYSSNESAPDSGRSDTEEVLEGRIPTEGIMLTEALELLSCRWDRFDGPRALRMLPSETKLQDLLPFLERVLQNSSGSQLNCAITKNLRRSESIQVHNELIQYRKKAIKMTGERTCSKCRKKIGSSVFAVCPDGALYHFGCYQGQGAKMGTPTAFGS